MFSPSLIPFWKGITADIMFNVIWKENKIENAKNWRFVKKNFIARF